MKTETYLQVEKPAPDFTVRDVFYHLNDLAGMIDSILIVVSEMSYANADGSRNKELDRVHSMLRIAEREASRQRDVLSMFDRPETWITVDDQMQIREAPDV